MKLITEEEASKLVNDEELKLQAVQNVEQNGIVFLDEIDKITSRSETSGADVSRQGVQRDLLPLVEGTTISTKYGMIKTDHILFIASGAFHLAKPSDLIPELQGRFPIRVELTSLSADDFVQILTNTDACLTRQYEACWKRKGSSWNLPPERCDDWRRSLFRLTKKPKISARGVYIPRWRSFWKRCLSMPKNTMGPRWLSMPNMSIRDWIVYLKARIWRATCCNYQYALFEPR